MRVIARASAASGTNVSPIAAGAIGQFIGPTLLLPPLTPTQGLRIVHAMAAVFDAGNSNALFSQVANIAVSLATLNPPGPLVATRVRHYQANAIAGIALSVEGLRFGVTDPELILGNDYLEIISATANAAKGAFAISIETDISNTSAAAQNISRSITVLYEVVELTDFKA